MFLGGPLMLLGAIVLAGWIYGIQELTSISQDWVTMKPLAAIGFILCGLVISFIGEHRSRWREWALAVVSFQAMYLGAVLLVLQLFNASLGLEKLLFNESSPVHTVDNEPSIATAICLMLVGGAALGEFLNKKIILEIFGASLMIISSSAVIGYLIEEPAMFFFIEKHSTGMAFHTALGFLYAGWAIRAIAKRSYKFNRRTNEKAIYI